MSNYRKRKTTGCDVCGYKIKCQDEGIVDLVGEKGQKHFWIKEGRVCPVDDRTEQLMDI